MKYEEADYVNDGGVKRIKVSDYTSQQLEEMKMVGKFQCPGKNCDAELCLVHSSKNGGRTYFLKASNDSKHSADCDYKIGNYKAISIREPENGYFTEQQVNNHVRMVDKDVNEPLKPHSDRKKKTKNSKDKKNGQKNQETGDKQIRKTTNSGRIVYGDDGAEGTKGRMSRAYTIAPHDIGKMKTIYGDADIVCLDEFGQLHISYKDDRLENIDVIAGPIIEHNYPTIYANLYLVEKCFEEKSKKGEVRITTGGLITEKKGKLVMELLTSGGVIIEGKTVNDLIMEHIRKTV